MKGKAEKIDTDDEGEKEKEKPKVPARPASTLGWRLSARAKRKQSPFAQARTTRNRFPRPVNRAWEKDFLLPRLRDAVASVNTLFYQSTWRASGITDARIDDMKKCVHKTEENYESYTAWFQKMRQGSTYIDQVGIALAAQAFRVRIVVIGSWSSGAGDGSRVLLSSHEALSSPQATHPAHRTRVNGETRRRARGTRQLLKVTI